MDIVETKDKSPKPTRLPETYEKGWGKEDWIHNDERYCGKVLTLFRHKYMSYHYHKKKHETFYLLSGKVFVTLGDLQDEFFRIPTKMFIMYPGEVLEIPPNTPHSVLALDDSAIMEVSTEHFENDSFRIVKGD